MKIKVFNPKEDLQGNQRENIFIVMDEDNNYLGSGYVFPRLTPQLTPEHPLNIFLDMHLEEAYLNHEIGRRLLESLEKRAKDLASVHPKATYLYHGSVDENALVLGYLKGRGYEVEKPSYMMYRSLPKEYFEIETKYDLIMSPSISESLQEEIISRHDEIFIQKLSKEQIHEYTHHDDFKNISLFDKGELLGNLMIYVETVDGVKIGKIENLFVRKECRHQGLGTLLMQSAYNFFNSHFIQSVSLEVWSGTEAMAFYEIHGFEVVKPTEYYIGKLI